MTAALQHGCLADVQLQGRPIKGGQQRGVTGRLHDVALMICNADKTCAVCDLCPPTNKTLCIRRSHLFQGDSDVEILDGLSGDEVDASNIIQGGELFLHSLDPGQL